MSTEQTMLEPCPFCGKSYLFSECEDFTASYMCNDCVARGPPDKAITTSLVRTGANDEPLYDGKNVRSVILELENLRESLDGNITLFSHHKAMLLKLVEENITRLRASAVATATTEWHCPKCGAGVDERFDCCEVHASTAAAAQPDTWQPIATKPSFIECEERGIYTDAPGGGLFYFKPTHWRPRNAPGATQPKCARCGSSGDTYVLCSGCGASVPNAPGEVAGGREPVAWIVLSHDQENIRIWWLRKDLAEEWAKTHSAPMIPLYAHPRCTDAILPLTLATLSPGGGEVRKALADAIIADPTIVYLRECGFQSSAKFESILREAIIRALSAVPAAQAEAPAHTRPQSNTAAD